MQRSHTSQIRLARTRKGLTQQQLADRVKVSKSAVCGWEKRREDPSSNRLAALHRALAPHLDLVRLVRELERGAA